MADREAAMLLSPAARKCGFRKNGYLCFEEDCCEPVVLRELLDQKRWSVPERVKDPAAFERAINRNIQKYHPEYWSARQRRLERTEHRKRTPPVPVK